MPNWRAHADLLNEKAEQAEKMLAGLVKDAMTAEERAELAWIEAEKAAKEEAEKKSGTLTTDHPPPPFFSTPPVARRTRLA